MKLKKFGLSLFCLAMLVTVAGAQDSDIMRIRRISVGTESTPEYSLQTTQPRVRTRDWTRITVQYDTEPDWIDELEMTFYALCENRRRDERFALFRGSVTYVNIEQGRRHEAVMYLHPSTVARFGSVEGVAVVASRGGRPVAMESDPSGRGRWWEQFSPVDGMLLKRTETPFAVLNYDAYQAIKRE